MAMIKCPKCGRTYSSIVKKCPACKIEINNNSQPLPKYNSNSVANTSKPAPSAVCPSCGNVVEDTAAFCSACGTKLGQPQVPQQPQQPQQPAQKPQHHPHKHNQNTQTHQQSTSKPKQTSKPQTQQPKVQQTPSCQQPNSKGSVFLPAGWDLADLIKKLAIAVAAVLTMYFGATKIMDSDIMPTDKFEGTWAGKIDDRAPLLCIKISKNGKTYIVDEELKGYINHDQFLDVNTPVDFIKGSQKQKSIATNANENVLPIGGDQLVREGQYLVYKNYQLQRIYNYNKGLIRSDVKIKDITLKRYDKKELEKLVEQHANKQKSALIDYMDKYNNDPTCIGEVTYKFK